MGWYPHFKPVTNSLALGTTNHWSVGIWTSMGDRSAKETIARGFFFVDDYPEVLDVVENGAAVTTLDGQRYQE